MVYEAAVAVAERDQSQLRSREDKGGGRSRQRQAPEEEEKVAMRCGVLGILRRVLPLPTASASSEKK
ncbi:unnamed protein product [Miscanthus lutarioriparius]|uniref:Uncharacterized protein n=1 Tax=Miscanthus lutarioriparius TaxID=422564 RepID=A0A811SQ55_9POAL|nr:unnamed protein product [Miscanthus lutarioriparius]CAD6343375.1 unnamed protein product [Miscanthus lutarioriparius]